MPVAATAIAPATLTALNTHPLYEGAATTSRNAEDLFLQQTRWAVLTGASSSGKSTIIKALEARGLPVVHESATRYFEEQQRRGHSIPELFATPAQSQKTQRELNRSILAGELALDLSAQIFLDRGFPDNLFFTAKMGMDPTGLIPLAFLHHYQTVFILDPVPYERAGHRVEHQLGIDDAQLEKDRREMDGGLEQVYRNLGYEPIRVPVMPVADRVKFILDRVGALN